MKNTKNGKKKRVFYCYAVYECEKEAARLTAYSEKGWHAVKAHMFGATLEKDDSARYVYQIDRRPCVPDERYFDTYRELGWEFVDDCNRCYYFRKPYDEKAPAEEYELYSDTGTMAENFRGDARAFGILAAAYACITVSEVWNAFRDPRVFTIAAAVSMTIFVVVMALISLSMRIKMKTGKGSLLSGKALVLLSLAGLLVASLPLWFEKAIAPEYLYTKMSWGAFENADDPGEPASDALDFTVKKDGKCLVDVDIDCAEGTVGIDIVDSEGNVCYRIDPCMKWDAVETVELPAGDYEAVYTANMTADTKVEITVRPRNRFDACA